MPARRPPFSDFCVRRRTCYHELYWANLNLVMYARVWLCTPVYGQVCPCMPTYTSVWPCTHVYGHVCLCMSTSTSVCPCTSVYGYVGPCTLLMPSPIRSMLNHYVFSRGAHSCGLRKPGCSYCYLRIVDGLNIKSIRVTGLLLACEDVQ